MFSELFTQNYLIFTFKKIVHLIERIVADILTKNIDLVCASAFEEPKISISQSSQWIGFSENTTRGFYERFNSKSPGIKPIGACKHWGFINWIREKLADFFQKRNILKKLQIIRENPLHPQKSIFGTLYLFHSIIYLSILFNFSVYIDFHINKAVDIPNS